ncbi:MAG: SRPBCC domain-containing protein [Gemmatimonadetes bacterium]|nr:SRPBCC domain-containing protein [Gemmatimonadota bacterium]
MPPTRRDPATPVGRTRDTGFQIGVRRTLDLPAEDAWKLLTSPEGAETWLGRGDGIDLAPGTAYRLADGSHGEVRVFVPGSHLRATRQPGDWPRPSTVQVRVLPKGERSVVAFHEEHLPGAPEREERREHYSAALDALERLAGEW